MAIQTTYTDRCNHGFANNRRKGNEKWMYMCMWDWQTRKVQHHLNSQVTINPKNKDQMTISNPQLQHHFDVDYWSLFVPVASHLHSSSLKVAKTCLLWPNTDVSHDSDTKGAFSAFNISWVQSLWSKNDWDKSKPHVASKLSLPVSLSYQITQRIVWLSGCLVLTPFLLWWVRWVYGMHLMGNHINPCQLSKLLMLAWHRCSICMLILIL